MKKRKNRFLGGGIIDISRLPQRAQRHDFVYKSV